MSTILFLFFLFSFSNENSDKSKLVLEVTDSFKGSNCDKPDRFYPFTPGPSTYANFSVFLVLTNSNNEVLTDEKDQPIYKSISFFEAHDLSKSRIELDFPKNIIDYNNIKLFVLAVEIGTTWFEFSKFINSGKGAINMFNKVINNRGKNVIKELSLEEILVNDLYNSQSLSACLEYANIGSVVHFLPANFLTFGDQTDDGLSLLINHSVIKFNIYTE